jgi:hypothetical protein
MSNPLIVRHDDYKAMEQWPLELRALFDPHADRLLAEKVWREKARQAPAGQVVCPHPEDYREGINCALCNDSGFISADQASLSF